MTDGQHEGTDDTPAGIPVLAGGRLASALEASLAALQVADTDQALATLLGLYARELDGADAVAARAAKVARDVVAELGPESALHERVQALEAALSKRTALDRIGSRLHAGLVEMLGTPKSRSAARPKPGAEQSADESETASPAVSRRRALELLQGSDEVAG